MSDPAILVENLSKRYLISHRRSKDDGLRHVLQETLTAPFRTLRQLGAWGRKPGANSASDPPSLSHLPSSNAPRSEEFWALNDVSFQVMGGEAVGIIGHNGAGKSTILKLLSRITEPTCGRIHLRGKVASLLEVGTGFHPELTGRENIFLNGAILGMTRTEIRRKFDEIVAFAEIEKFLDTPVKRYSSGMYVRLAFAVAAHLEPEILLVDEVLAVGDAAFQRKCMSKIGQVAEGGRTVLFVSHNMAAITRLCGRALWFDRGQLRESGDAEKIVANYLAFGTEEAGEITYSNNGHKAPGSEYVRLEAIRVRGSDGTVTQTLDVRLPFTLEVQYRVLKRATNLRVGVQINTQDGTTILATTDMDSQEELVREPGVYTSCCKLPGEFLNHGQYYVAVGCDFPTVQTHFHVDPALAFYIAQTGGVGGHINDDRKGMLRVRLPWKVERTST